MLVMFRLPDGNRFWTLTPDVSNLMGVLNPRPAESTSFYAVTRKAAVRISPITMHLEYAIVGAIWACSFYFTFPDNASAG